MTREPAPSRFGRTRSPLELFEADRKLLSAGDHSEPHRILGAHPATVRGRQGAVLRAYHPDAVRAECLPPGAPPIELEALSTRGLFAVFLEGAVPPFPYRLRFRFPGGAAWERDDPYRFLPTVGEVDLHLFGEGNHRRLWQCMGARRLTVDGVEGVSFCVWAPNARRVSVVGDFCGWDGRLYPMRSLGGGGVFELFIPALPPGAIYKYEIKTRWGDILRKTDPFARSMEHPPATASRVFESEYAWGDDAWMASRTGRDWGREPMAIYEAHLGSWDRVREEGWRPLSYREFALRIVPHLQRFGFTHLELLPVTEHPFAGSWGYQTSGYYAPTARYGSPDDFRFLVDHCHQNGIGVILDWVPGHFPKDDFSLARFDGTALYEHEDPQQAEHPDWGTLIFNYGRNEVRNFLIANALYWMEEFHVDGLRVDAVASMLYLDYSRKPGQWRPNRYGGRENLDALDFLRTLNETIRVERPGCFTVAEESTAWPGVSRPAAEGGLGFTFKWNMGWMHDTLQYFSKNPFFRRHHHDRLTFAMLYEYSERFIMPLSHDEVVHGKGSLLGKMPGDEWQRFANLRLLLAYQYTRPGKVLLFMGTELATPGEWNHDVGLDWGLAEDPRRAGFTRFLEDLGRLYLDTPPLWASDHDPSGFSWIDCQDREGSIFSYVRRNGDRSVVVVLNLTPVPRADYRIGVPVGGPYEERMSTDREGYGGSGYPTHPSPVAEPVPFHGHSHSLVLHLPPLGALILSPAR